MAQLLDLAFRLTLRAQTSLLFPFPPSANQHAAFKAVPVDNKQNIRRHQCQWWHVSPFMDGFELGMAHVRHMYEGPSMS